MHHAPDSLTPRKEKSQVPNVEIRTQRKRFLNSDYSVYEPPAKERYRKNRIDVKRNFTEKKRVATYVKPTPETHKALKPT